MGSLGKRIIAAMLVLFISICFLEYAKDQGTIQDISEADAKVRATGLILGYEDEKVGAYLKNAAEKYKVSYGLEVTCRQMKEEDYLSSIYASSMKKDANMPDLFLLRNDRLERAAELGLACSSKELENFCNADNFSKTAQKAVSYRGKPIAYPLCFNVLCVIYNKDVMSAPSKMDDITNFAESSNVPENVEQILDFNCNDVMCSYAFIGNAVSFSEATKEAKSRMKVDDTAATAGLNSYHSLMQYFAIDKATANSKAVLQGFLDGRTVCIFADLPMAAQLSDAKAAGTTNVNYAIAPVPAINEQNKSCIASFTKTVVVNAFSSKQSLASEFAEFLSGKYADNMYAVSGFLPAKKGVKCKNPELNKLNILYKQSTQFPKLFATDDFYLRMDVLISEVSKGNDILQSLHKFSETYGSRLE